MRRLLFGLVTLPFFAALVACTSSPPAEETASQSSKSENLECLPLHFSRCEWRDVGVSEQRRIVMGYQIWGSPDDYGNCLYAGVPYDQIEPTVRAALANGEVPDLGAAADIRPYIRQLCGFEFESCALVIDDRGSGLPNVYGKCYEL
jgi:hypothetical protein